jgi:hypothetical protein
MEQGLVRPGENDEPEEDARQEDLGVRGLRRASERRARAQARSPASGCSSSPKVQTTSGPARPAPGPTKPGAPRPCAPGDTQTTAAIALPPQEAEHASRPHEIEPELAEQGAAEHPEWLVYP